MTELELSGTAYADHQLGPWQTLASSWSQLLCRCLWLWPSHGFCELHLSTGFIIDLTVAHKHEHERLSQSSKWHRIVQVIAMAVSLMIDSHGGVAVLASAVKSLWVLNHRVGAPCLRETIQEIVVRTCDRCLSLWPATRWHARVVAMCFPWITPSRSHL